MRSSPGLSPMAIAREVPQSGATADPSPSRQAPTASRATGVPQVIADPAAGAAPRLATVPTPVRSRPVRAAIGLVLLAGLWAVLTGGDPGAWVFGVPAVSAGLALILVQSPAPGWRLSPVGAVRFSAWFAVQSVRGAVDVARRALAWRLPLAPGCRPFRTALPDGAPRILFANAITLLPGTLTAEFEGDLLVVHMLDTGADLTAELGALERRVARLFALPDGPGAGEGTV